MLNRFATRFRESKSGMAAVEFALIVPIMLATFFGVAEISDYILSARKVAGISSVAADLVAQNKTISNADMTDVMDALNVIMHPYNPSQSTIRISSIVADNNGTRTIRWSDARRVSPFTAGSPAPGWVPATVVPANSSVIVAEVSFNYQSLFGMYLTSGMTVSDTFYMRPRRSIEVDRTQ